MKPQSATSANPIARARALLHASDPDAADLEQAIADVERHATEAEATITRLAGERADVVAAGTRADAVAHDERAADHGFARDQARELAARLKVALVPAMEADRRARAAADREKVEVLAAEAVAALGDYPAAMKAILGILGIVAHADMAAAEFNLAHPGEQPIASAEARVRWTPSATTKGEPVRGWAWALEDGRILDRAPHQSRPLPDDRRVPDEAGSPGRLLFPANAALLVDGSMRPSGRADGSMLDTRWHERDFLAEIAEHRLAPNTAYVFRLHNGPRVWPVEVWRTPVATVPADRPAALAETVSLPPLRIGDKGWKGHDGSPAEILAALAQAPVDPRRPERKTAVEQVVEGGRLVSLLPSTKLEAQAIPAQPQPVVEQEFAMNTARLNAG